MADVHVNVAATAATAEMWALDESVEVAAVGALAEAVPVVEVVPAVVAMAVRWR